MKPEVPLSDQKRKAREIVLKTLYEIEMGGLDEAEATRKIRHKCRRPQMREFALHLMAETLKRIPDLDRLIAEVAENWDLKRMAVIDRNVLRMGITEILFIEDIPNKVAINEAIEIAKRFSTENSGRFVNGILDKVARTKGEIRDNI